LCVILIATNPTALAIQSTPQIIQKVNSENGGTDAIVNDMLTDQYGRLWLASTAGIFVYDGKKAEKLKLESPSGAGFHALYFHKNKMWIGSDKGLGVVDSIDLNKSRFFDMDKYGVSSLVVKDDEIWFGTFNQGLFTYNLGTSKVTTVELPANIRSKTIRDIKLSEDGKVWVAVYTMPNSNSLLQGGLLQFSDDEIKTFYDDSLFAITALEFVGDSIYLSSSNQGIKKFSVTSEKDIGTIGEVTALNAIHDLDQDNAGCLWAASQGAALKICDNKISQFEYGSSFLKTLPAKDLYRSHYDKQNEILWLSGMSGGVAGIYAPENRAIEYLVKNPNSSLSSNDVYALNIDKSGALWVGHNGDGIDVFQPDGAYKNYEISDEPRANHVISIFHHPDGRVFAGTFGGGIWYKRAKEEQFNRFTEESETLNKLVVTDFIADGENIWVSTIRELFLFDNDGKIISSFSQSNFEDPPLFFALANIDKENIMLGTSIGVFKINKENLKVEDGWSKNIPKNCIGQISDVVTDSIGDIWFAPKSICRYSTVKNAIEEIQEYSESVPSASALSISEENKLYIFGGKLLVFNLNSHEFELLSKSQGLFIDSEVPSFGAIDSFGDRVVFATTRGIAWLNTNERSGESLYTNPLFVKSIRKMNQQQAINDNRNKLEIEMQFNERIVSVDLGLAEYFNRDLKYSMSVPGQLERPINLHHPENIALPTGVEGAHEISLDAFIDGSLADNIEINLVVLPPWWRSTAAYISYLVGFLLVLVGTVILRSRGLKTKNILLEQLVERRTNELKESVKSKEMLLENITHELKTPITVILGRTELLLKNNQLDQNVSIEVEKIHKNTQRLHQLVGDVLKFCENNDYKGTKEVIDIIEVTKFVVESLSSYAKSRGKNIELKIQNSIEFKRVLFQVGGWESIVSNLVTNAVKHGINGNAVNIELNFYNGIEFRVINTGERIDPATQSKIFTRYESSGTEIDSNGIGLAIVKDLVEHHDGTIEVRREKSKNVFLIQLPHSVIVKPRAVVNSTEFTNFVGSSCEAPENHILIVEDNKELQELMVKALGVHYKCSLAVDGNHAMELLAKEAIPDLILSDVMMPNMDGLELCNRLKQDSLYKHIPIFLLTAKSDSNSVKEGLSVSADDYIPKPFKTDILISKINNQINTRNALKQTVRSNLIFEGIDKSKASTGDKSDVLVVNVKKLLEKYYIDSEIKGQDLAAHLHQSERTINRKLKVLLGSSLNELLREYRLERAKSMLEKGVSAKEACFQCGFNSLSYFSRSFKAKYFVAPSDI